MRRMPTPAAIAAAWRDLVAKRADPDPVKDQEAFDEAWGGNFYQKSSDDFQQGDKPHQKMIAMQLEFDYKARMGSLAAVNAEAQNYLNTFALLLVVLGLLLQDQIAKVIHTPNALWAWLPLAALYFLLSAHASNVSAHFDNYEGAGSFAGEVTTKYAYYNRLREYMLRRNADMQRAKRRLATVYLLYSACILLIGIAITFAAFG